VANKRHLTQLKKGVVSWNQWRKNSNLSPDLSHADLQGLKLGEINFAGVNLRGANLRAADLSHSDLSYADLTEADLTKADLSHSTCILANFSHAYLHKANLILVDLSEANFFGADLSRASLKNSQLFMANLASTQLDQAHLSEADLFMSILARADLSGASLSYSNLSRADLTGAILIATEALATDFTEAIFTEACLQDWNINSETKLEKVECDYIYLRVKWYEEDEEIKGNFFERRPSDPNQKFAPGEFTKLFHRVLNTIDLIFRNGVDWQALVISLEKLRVEAEGVELTIQAIENKDDGAFVVRVGVPPEANKAKIENFFRQEYDQVLKTQEDRLKIQGEQLDFYRQQITIERQNSTNLLGVIQVMAENQTPKYDMRGSNFGNFADKVQSGGKQQSVQHIYASESRQSIVEAAQEIQALLKQLEVTNPHATEDQQMAYVNSAIPPTLKQRVVAALKNCGETAVDEFLLENKYLKIGKAVVKGWLQANS
jgi:uncharacterized protein YjbI with pentapeptide repeats